MRSRSRNGILGEATSNRPILERGPNLNDVLPQPLRVSALCDGVAYHFYQPGIDLIGSLLITLRAVHTIHRQVECDRRSDRLK